MRPYLWGTKITGPAETALRASYNDKIRLQMGADVKRERQTMTAGITEGKPLTHSAARHGSSLGLQESVARRLGVKSAWN